MTRARHECRACRRRSRFGMRRYLAGWICVDGARCTARILRARKESRLEWDRYEAGA